MNFSVFTLVDEVVLVMHKLVSRLGFKVTLVSCFSEQLKAAGETFEKCSIGNFSRFAFAVLSLYEVRVEKIFLVLSNALEELEN